LTAGRLTGKIAAEQFRRFAPNRESPDRQSCRSGAGKVIHKLSTGFAARRLALKNACAKKRHLPHYHHALQTKRREKPNP
jgi:hypothetical protein